MALLRGDTNTVEKGTLFNINCCASAISIPYGCKGESTNSLFKK